MAMVVPIVPVKPVEVDAHGWEEHRLRTLAREVAMDIIPIEDVLKNHDVSEEEWDRIARSERFKAMLTSEVSVWNSAMNTEERTKVKAQALVEMALLPAQAMINDKSEPASARVEMLKTVAKIAGVMDKVQAGGAAPGEKFVINIGIGNGKKVTVEHVTPQVIDGSALDLTDHNG